MADDHDSHGGHDEDGESGRDGGHAPRGDHGGGHAAPGGLSVAADGLRIVPAETRFDPGADRRFAFRIEDAEGDVVTDFETVHASRLHLIVVRRDLVRFQHLHPEMDDGGTWRTALDLSAPGVYRAFADVATPDARTTLGADLFVPGEMDVASPPSASRRASAGGYDVTLRDAAFAPGAAADLTFDVRRETEPVRLEPHLGALGHLVALRDGDLAYLHVHPEAGDPDGGAITFRTRFPSRGRYRLFLQARPEGTLATTSFDVTVGE